MLKYLMPRRIGDYPDSFAGWNYLASFGSIISIVALILFLYIIYDLMTSKEDFLKNNYWSETEYFESNYYFNNLDYSNESIEFNISSPPKFHSYDILPIVYLNKNDN